ncbi:hypothetical protein [Streptomyces sp. NPDC051016]|uniref:hypothetical protein n=1 Tax=Streptomyces sp. NPDC051016 TaxID=3365638 RepID=UPI0037AABD05
MSARDELIEIVTRDPQSSGGDTTWATDLVDAHQAEVLAADGQAYDGELAMLRTLIRTLRAVARTDDPLPELRRLLWLHAEDDAGARNQADGKNTRPTAAATPGLTLRQTRLLSAIRTHGGEWTTRRVLGLYALTDPSVVHRGTARRDLATLQRAGHLVLVDDPDNRHYVLHTRKDGA